jgi:hypothetical protein
LLVHTINTQPMATDPKIIGLTRLCEKLGITVGEPARTLCHLHRAFDVVNGLLGELTEQDVAELEREGIEVPESYQIQPQRNPHWVRIVCTPRHTRDPDEVLAIDEDEYEEEQPIQRKPQPKPIERVQFTPEALQRLDLQREQREREEAMRRLPIPVVIKVGTCREERDWNPWAPGADD